MQLAPNWFLIDAPHWVLSYVGPELEKMFGRQAVYRGGLQVTTTLDLDLQKKAEAILEEKISDYEETSGGHNGALVALDPTTARSWPTSAAATISGRTSWARTTWRRP